MKKLITFYGALIIAVFFFSSCGGNKSQESAAEKIIPLPDPPAISYQATNDLSGPLKEFINVVEENCKLELKKEEREMLLGYGGSIQIKMKFTKSSDIPASYYHSYGPELTAKVLSIDGKPLPFELSGPSTEDIAKFIRDGGNREEWLNFTIISQGTIKSADEAQKMIDMFKEGKSIRFYSEIKQAKAESGGNESSSSSSESKKEEASSSSNSDCQKYLDGYEKFMDDYVKLLKKYKNDPTNTSLVTDYSKMMREASDWTQKIEGCKNDASVYERMLKIQQKIANAMVE